MKTVMIADDSRFMRNVLKTILGKNDYRVVSEAENGIQAIERYSIHSPDVVLMDVTMPGVDGVRALEEILKIDPDAIIIMISSLGTEYLVSESLKIGAKGYVVKPYFDQPIPLITDVS